MTKLKIIIISILGVFLFFNGRSQDTCCLDLGRPEPGIWFEDALNLCFLADEEECFSMRPWSITGAIPGCPSSNLQNTHSYILFPNSDDFSLEIETSDCGANIGIQVMLYKLAKNKFADSCHNLITIFDEDLSYEQLFCSGTMGLIQIDQSNARDEIFYLIIDGFQGEQCDYIIRSTLGTYKSAPRDSISLSGPTGLPQGYTATYTAERFEFDCFRHYDCQCGECGLDTFVVSWTGPPGSVVNPIPGTLSAEITMGPSSGQVCISIQDDCENLLSCLSVELTDSEFYQKCPPDDVFAHGENYFYPGTYYPEEDGMIYEVVVEDFFEELVEENIEACIGDRFFDCFFNPIEYPVTYNICFRLENDTCRTTETFITWYDSYDITIIDTICFGSQYIFCDDTFNNSTNSICNLVTSFGCDSVTQLELVVLPPDSNFVFEIICEGISIPFCGQDLSAPGVYSCLDTTMDGCIHVSVLDLMIADIDSFIVDTTLCFPEEFTLNGNTFNMEGTHTVDIPDAALCIDRFIINLSYDQVDTTFVLDTICQMDTYAFCGMTLTNPGVYYCAFQTAGPCDSVVELTLINPCPSPQYIGLCFDEVYEVSDSILDEAGVYYIESPYSASCTCIDTITIEYLTLNQSQIKSSAELSCEVESVTLSVGLDPTISVDVLDIDWIYEGLLVGTNDDYVASAVGEYSALLLFEDLVFNKVCSDTLSFMLEGSNMFDPTLTWINQELTVCDSNSGPYALEFVTSAPNTTLSLLNTNEAWSNQSNLLIDLPPNENAFYFELVLSNAGGACQEVHEFQVTRVDVNEVWPDSVYVASQGQNTMLINPLFELNGTPQNIAFLPADFITSNVNSEYISFNPEASGFFNLTFDVGSCSYEYSTFIVTNNIFIPNAFSPNNDGINDFFKAYPTSGFKLLEMTVYNRWGNQVFSRTIEPFTWNGRSDDREQEQGMYVVQYRYVDAGGNEYNGVSELMLFR